MQSPENIRAISDEFASDGNTPSSFGLSNMVWSFGQFIGAPLMHTCTPANVQPTSMTLLVTCSNCLRCSDQASGSPCPSAL